MQYARPADQPISRSDVTLHWLEGRGDTGIDVTKWPDSIGEGMGAPKYFYKVQTEINLPGRSTVPACHAPVVRWSETVVA